MNFKTYCNIDNRINSFVNYTEKKIKDTFEAIDINTEYNQIKVLKAFQKNKVSEMHLTGTTGYGYNDTGRDLLDRVYADTFNCEDALVRHTIISGTHALTLCLFGILKPKDIVVSATGKPYDTLEEVIGLRGNTGMSLKDYDIHYEQINLDKNGKPDNEKLLHYLKQNEKVKLVIIQRSKGYDWRPSLTNYDIKDIIKIVKNYKSEIICMVDNCYGEFVDTIEPTEVGADIIAGSLIKNPGGGLALTGGYIAGRKDLVEKISYRHTSPGLGKECGPSLNVNRGFFQGFFNAPHIVGESLKSAVLCSAIFKELGFDICPDVNETRSDIIQAVKFNNPDHVITFCQGIQKGSPIDSYVEPTPWSMPGYDSEVIMAAGAFIQGSSIELSADGPLKEPYIAYMQGGLNYHSAKYGIKYAIKNMVEKEQIKIP